MYITRISTNVTQAVNLTLKMMFNYKPAQKALEPSQTTHTIIKLINKYKYPCSKQFNSQLSSVRIDINMSSVTDP